MKSMKRRRSSRAQKNSNHRRKADNLPIGVVGLGLMGSSIATCLLAAGHPVCGVEIDPARRRAARRHVHALLKEMKSEDILKTAPLRSIRRLEVSGDYSLLRNCKLVVECVTESLKTKKKVIRKVEEVVSPKTILGSNTSAIPVSQLQEGAIRPGRILGIHWAEPAHTTRFMEIICGRSSNPACAVQVKRMAETWGKEPSILRRDIRGFITNRCMYALLREAFHLVESGYATMEDVDRSLRNDFGYWITFAGPFRFMDLTGIPAYRAVMRDLLPDLSNETKVPELMDRLVRTGARGVSNAKGFYRYTRKSAQRWERLFLKFSYEIRALALKYPEDVGGRSSIGKKNGIR